MLLHCSAQWLTRSKTIMKVFSRKNLGWGTVTLTTELLLRPQWKLLWGIYPRFFLEDISASKIAQIHGLSPQPPLCSASIHRKKQQTKRKNTQWSLTMTNNSTTTDTILKYFMRNCEKTPKKVFLTQPFFWQRRCQALDIRGRLGRVPSGCRMLGVFKLWKRI